MRIKILYTCIIYMFAINHSYANDYQFEPYIIAQQLFSDNILLDDDNKQAEFATTLSPGFYATRDGSRLKARLNFALEHIIISGGLPDNTVPNLRFDGISELFEDHLFLDASVNNGQQNVTTNASISGDNISNLANREDVFFYRLNPFWKQKISNIANVTIGHTYDEILSDISDSNSNLSYINIVNGTEAQRLLFDFRASYRTVELENFSDDISYSNIQNRFIYPVTRNFSATATLGYDNDDIPTLNDTSGPLWNVGFLWRPSKNTDIDFSIGERYFGSDFAIEASYGLGKTEFRFTYNRDRQTARDLLTDDATEILFARGASGLLDENGNIIEDRSFVSPSVLDVTGIDQNIQTILNTELRAVAIYTLRRNVFRLGFFLDENEFQQIDNTIDTIGAELNWERQITRTVSGNLNIAFQNRDLDNDLESDDYLVDLFVAKQLTPKLELNFGYGFAKFDINDPGFSGFTENRIFLGVNQVF